MTTPSGGGGALKAEPTTRGPALSRSRTTPRVYADPTGERSMVQIGGGRPFKSLTPEGRSRWRETRGQDLSGKAKAEQTRLQGIAESAGVGGGDPFRKEKKKIVSQVIQEKGSKWAMLRIIKLALMNENLPFKPTPKKQKAQRSGASVDTGSDWVIDTGIGKTARLDAYTLFKYLPEKMQRRLINKAVKQKLGLVGAPKSTTNKIFRKMLSPFLKTY